MAANRREGSGVFHGGVEQELFVERYWVAPDFRSDLYWCPMFPPFSRFPICRCSSQLNLYPSVATHSPNVEPTLQRRFAGGRRRLVFSTSVSASPHLSTYTFVFYLFNSQMGSQISYCQNASSISSSPSPFRQQ